MKILLVTEDEAVKSNISTILKRNLKIKDTIVISDGKSALEEIRKETGKDAMSAMLGGKPKVTCSIDLILIDATLSSMSTEIFCRGIRKSFNKKQLPILVITEGTDKEAILKDMQAGANNFLLKPTNADILNKKIAEVCGKEDSNKVVKSAFSNLAPPKDAKKKSQSSVLSRIVSDTSSKSSPRLMGGAYHKRDDKPIEDNGAKAKIDESGKIEEGHYHERVDVIGGGINCFWARQEDNPEKVELYYMSAKGKPTNMHAKTVTKDDFIENFRLCTPEVCPILKRLEG